MLTLTVVNRMLAVMGQAPINTLQSGNRWLGPCLGALNNENVQVQSKGYWFNTDITTFSPSAADGRVYLPSDIIGLMSVDIPVKQVSQRGPHLYDNKNGTEIFDTDVKLEIRRLVPFEKLPEVAANAVATRAIHWAQLTYDGDPGKVAKLEQYMREADIALNTEQTNQSRSNLIDSNRSIQMIRTFRRRTGNRIPIR